MQLWIWTTNTEANRELLDIPGFQEKMAELVCQETQEFRENQGSPDDRAILESRVTLAMLAREVYRDPRD